MTKNTETEAKKDKKSESDLKELLYTQMTDSDKETLNKLPDGWFCKTEIPYTIKRADYRMKRLIDMGAVEWRIKPELMAQTDPAKAVLKATWARDYRKR